MILILLDTESGRLFGPLLGTQNKQRFVATRQGHQQRQRFRVDHRVSKGGSPRAAGLEVF